MAYSISLTFIYYLYIVHIYYINIYIYKQVFITETGSQKQKIHSKTEFIVATIEHHKIHMF